MPWETTCISGWFLYDTEKELEEGMHELCKAQDALLKAVERRLEDIALIERKEEQKNRTFHHFFGKVIR